MILTNIQILNGLVRNQNVWKSMAKGVKLSMILLFCCSISLSAQDRSSTPDDLNFLNDELATVTGMVTDADGEGLIGVNILVKGTSSGTVTDLEGKYSVNVPEGYNTLVFSYTGYSSVEINVDSRATVDVMMKSDAELLEEVVVIGYGTVKKSDLTGAVASLSGKDIASVSAGNPTSALQGKVSGVQIENNGAEPGGDANVFVRGVSSLTNSYPLYVIDGTFADNMSYINPKDIERIEVLKDASAAAIYGSRAANGVVIIQTKRGTANGTPKVSLDIRGGVESPDNYLNFLNAQEFVDYRNQRDANDGLTPMLTYDPNADTDWQDLSLNPGNIQDYGLSISGGGENSKYYISGNYFDQDGILVSTGYNRVNFRANTEF